MAAAYQQQGAQSAQQQQQGRQYMAQRGRMQPQGPVNTSGVGTGPQAMRQQMAQQMAGAGQTVNGGQRQLGGLQAPTDYSGGQQAGGGNWTGPQRQQGTLTTGGGQATGGNWGGPQRQQGTLTMASGPSAQPMQGMGNRAFNAQDPGMGFHGYGATPMARAQSGMGGSSSMGAGASGNHYGNKAGGQADNQVTAGGRATQVGGGPQMASGVLDPQQAGGLSHRDFHAGGPGGGSIDAGNGRVSGTTPWGTTFGDGQGGFTVTGNGNASSGTGDNGSGGNATGDTSNGGGGWGGSNIGGWDWAHPGRSLQELGQDAQNQVSDATTGGDSPLARGLKSIGNVAGTVTDEMNAHDQGQLQGYYQDQFNRWNDIYGQAHDLTNPALQQQAEDAARQQLDSQINTQRDADLRMQQGQMSRGGAQRSGDQQGVYNSGLMAQQAGERGLAQDAFKRKLEAMGLGMQGESAANQSLQDLKGQGFTSTKDLLAMLLLGGDRARAMGGDI